MAKPKILLVDDTRLVLELEKSFLKLSDVEVLTAGNGVEALNLIRKDPPDLIFMDLNMPEMDGISCCSIIKSDPFLSNIPVIMLTTAGRDEDRERAMKAGCDGYLTKPIDRVLFLETARKYADAIDRREPRIPCHLPILCLFGNTPHSARALNVGDGGVFVASHEKVRVDMPLKVAFYLPFGSPVLMEMASRVAWVNEEDKRVHHALPAGFGVQFTDLDEEKSALLRAFLEPEVQKGSFIKMDPPNQ